MKYFRLAVFFLPGRSTSRSATNKRIAPFSLCGKAIILLSAAVRQVPVPVSAGQVLANLLMVQSWPLVYQDSINIPGWSLSVEAFLYLLVFPGTIFLRRRHTGLLALLTMPCAAIALWLQHDNGPLLDRLPGAYLLEGRRGFLIGFALRQCVPKGVRSRFVDLASMLAVAAALLAFFDVLPKMALALIFPSIVAFSIDQRTFLSRALSQRDSYRRPGQFHDSGLGRSQTAELTLHSLGTEHSPLRWTRSVRGLMFYPSGNISGIGRGVTL